MQQNFLLNFFLTIISLNIFETFSPLSRPLPLTATERSHLLNASSAPALRSAVTRYRRAMQGCLANAYRLDSREVLGRKVRYSAAVTTAAAAVTTTTAAVTTAATAATKTAAAATATNALTCCHETSRALK